MATWIRCHDPHDVEILVNIDLIITMKASNGGAYVKFGEEGGLYLKETPEDIVHANPVRR